MAQAKLDAHDGARMLAEVGHHAGERGGVVRMDAIGRLRADCLGGEVAENLGDRRALVCDDARFVDHRDDVGRVTDESTEALLAGSNLVLTSSSSIGHPGDGLAHEQARRYGVRGGCRTRGTGSTDDVQRREVRGGEQRREAQRRTRAMSQPEPHEDHHVEEAVSKSVGVARDVEQHDDE